MYVWKLIQLYVFLMTHNSSLLSQYRVLQGGENVCVGGALWRDKFMNNIAERHCGHIKAVRLQCQRWCHQKAVSRGGLGTLWIMCPRIRFALQRILHNSSFSLCCGPPRLDMIPGQTSFSPSVGLVQFNCVRPSKTTHSGQNGWDLIILWEVTDKSSTMAAACGPARTRHSLSVKEPVSSLPQIYGDASEKLSHMVSKLLGG